MDYTEAERVEILLWRLAAARCMLAGDAEGLSALVDSPPDVDYPGGTNALLVDATTYAQGNTDTELAEAQRRLISTLGG